MGASHIDSGRHRDRLGESVALGLLVASIVVLPPRNAEHPATSAIATVSAGAPSDLRPVASGRYIAAQGDRVQLRPTFQGGEAKVPSAVRSLANQVLATDDNEARDFVVIDKPNARIFAIGSNGVLIGDAPVLLGLAKGDDSVPGIGTRPISQIRPFERTTPAGRFVASSGVNIQGEDIVWVDFDAAISMHRVRPVNPKERRLQRLASPSVTDNRISYGCINMPPAFFNHVIAPMFSNGAHAVYVLPDVKSMKQVFHFPGDAPANHPGALPEATTSG